MTRRTALQTLVAAMPAATAPQQRFVGITILPEYIQNETIDGVLQRLESAGVTAVATSPYVMEPGDEATGSREPPIDAGAGKVRLLDRPLWGKRELFVRTAPSFTPDTRLYKGLRYQPPPPTELTRKEGSVLAEFIRGAHARRMEVYFQIQAAIPPAFRVQFGGPTEEDRPRLPDGRIPPRRLANNGSLASEEIRRYHYALVRDLLRVYPDIDGIRVDWPEYPPYLLDDVFLDFSEPARIAAERYGLGFKRMQADASRAYQYLHGRLTERDLTMWSEGDGSRFGLLGAMRDAPGLAELMRFKAMLVSELIAGYRKTLTEAGGRDKKLLPNAFPPPFTLASGMDFHEVAKSSDGISVKLYTMHWPMMLRFYAEQLLKANPSVPEELVVRSVARMFDITDGRISPKLADWTYPEPEVPHPVGPEAQRRKIRQAKSAAGSTPVYALAHGYGPLEDFRSRLQVAWKASGGRVWINRYGYLSNEKLDAVGQVTRA